MFFSFSISVLKKKVALFFSNPCISVDLHGYMNFFLSLLSAPESMWDTLRILAFRCENNPHCLDNTLRNAQMCDENMG